MLSNGLWPYRPRMEPGESFSSWFSRLALSNGLTPRELYRIALPGARMYRCDLDRAAPEVLLANLAERTGMNMTSLEHSTFRRWHGSLIGGTVEDAKHPWLPAASCYARTQSHGQQYCPECLAGDDIPFLRLEWRLAFTTTCREHKTLFRDRCPKCAASIAAAYASLGTQTMAECWKCGFDLRFTTSDTDIFRQVIPDEHERRYMRALKEGWGLLGRSGPPIHAFLFFSVLWQLYRMVAAGRFSRPLRIAVCEQNPELAAAIPTPAIKQVERHPPAARRLLLAVTDELLNEWPKQLVLAAEKAGITSGDILKDRRNQPFALVSAIEKHLSKPLRIYSVQESDAVVSLLARNGISPTVKALRELTGRKIGRLENAAQPSSLRLAYGKHRYWKLDGISPSIRAKAKRAATRDGDNIGPWVEKAIIAVLAQRSDSDIL